MTLLGLTLLVRWSRGARRFAISAVLLAGLVAGNDTARAEAICSSTADLALTACGNQVRSDYLLARGACLNLPQRSDRSRCEADAYTARNEGSQLCPAQRAARGAVCAALGEGAHDPVIDPANFVDPLAIGSTVTPNPYLLLVPGYLRVYRSSEETITVTVTHSTIKIQGVRCIIVRDTVVVGGKVTEDTLDYFAQDLAGNVWYFGELVMEFAGGRLVSLDGSFESGVNGAKPGIAMRGAPVVGEVYRQEFALGEAEDLGQVLSTTASFTAPAAACAGTCLRTRDFSPLDPASDENKFFAPGIGEIASYHVDNPGDPEALVSYTFTTP